MRADEATGLGRWSGALLRGATTATQAVHAAVGRRGDAVAVAIVGPDAAPFIAIRRVVTDTVYRTVAFGVDAGARVVGLVAARHVDDSTSLTDTPRGNQALALVNGWHGDRLARAGSPLSLPMALRHEGHDLPADPDHLRAAFPDATGRLVLFAHGLAETEDYWRYRAQDHYGDPTVSYGSRLRDDLKYTPLWVRYNTGRRISDSGADLSALLDDVVANWPVPVTSLALIGHSMGGLVVQSALAQGAASDWIGLVRDTVSIATPHHGAALEQRVAAVATWAGTRESLTWLATVLRHRSVGIKDLRHGNLVPQDWVGHDPDDPVSHRVEVAVYPGARHHLALSTICRNTDGPVGTRIGDLLVTPVSGRGGPGGGRFTQTPASSVHIVGGLHHFDSLNHPDVYPQIRTWLTQ